MKQVAAIASREFKSLFITPIGYIVLLLFAVFMGLIFWWRVQQGEVVQDVFQEFIRFSRFGLFFIVPLLTMNTFSEEYSSGRIETLRTTPLTEMKLLAGKFLGTLGFYVMLLLCILPHIIAFKYTAKFGVLPLSQLLCCFGGLFIMGAMFVAVGIFYSSCTREQTVAGLLTLITLGALTVLDLFARYIPETWHLWKWDIKVRDQFMLLTVGKHIGDLASGQVDATGIPYFLILTLLFLFWTYMVMESKRWR